MIPAGRSGSLWGLQVLCWEVAGVSLMTSTLQLGTFTPSTSISSSRKPMEGILSPFAARRVRIGYRLFTCPHVGWSFFLEKSSVRKDTTEPESTMQNMLTPPSFAWIVGVPPTICIGMQLTSSRGFEPPLLPSTAWLTVVESSWLMLAACI